jgi:outer membrane protein assembly factor BamE (lipoprotein component of BamABCDE complex)
MKLPHLLALLTTIALAGCATATRSYVSNHPELTPDQRQIVTSGNIPDGEAVAGMTKSAIRTAMRGDPMQFTKIDGTDAWIYVREKGTGDFTNDLHSSSDSDQGPGAPHTSSLLNGQEERVEEHVTIFFQGDRATRAEVTREKIKPEADSSRDAPQ